MLLLCTCASFSILYDLILSIKIALIAFMLYSVAIATLNSKHTALAFQSRPFRIDQFSRRPYSHYSFLYYDPSSSA